MAWWTCWLEHSHVLHSGYVAACLKANQLEMHYRREEQTWAPVGAFQNLPAVLRPACEPFESKRPLTGLLQDAVGGPGRQDLASELSRHVYLLEP
jgi:hypothetical protein